MHYLCKPNVSKSTRRHGLRKKATNKGKSWSGRINSNGWGRQKENINYVKIHNSEKGANEGTAVRNSSHLNTTSPRWGAAGGRVPLIRRLFIHKSCKKDALHYMNRPSTPSLEPVTGLFTYRRSTLPATSSILRHNKKTYWEATRHRCPSKLLTSPQRRRNW